MMHSTPDISHLTADTYNFVYEPAEDSFLMLDALESDIETIKSRRPLICLEIGSGSGIVSTFLGQLLDSKALCLLIYVELLSCTDINEHAAVATHLTGQQNKICLNPVVCDLAAPLVGRLENVVDVLIFNPPYVVTPSDEVGGNGMEASWAGGIKGREVMDRLFPLVPRLLSNRGIFYLVTVKENDIEDIERQLKIYGLRMDIVLSRRSGAEKLTVTKFTKETIVDAV